MILTYNIGTLEVMNYEQVKDQLPNTFTIELFEKFMRMVFERGILDVSINEDCFVLRRGTTTTMFSFSHIESEKEFILNY